MSDNNGPAFRIKAVDKDNNLKYDVGTIWAHDSFKDQFNLAPILETDKDAKYPRMALVEALAAAADQERRFYINIYAVTPRTDEGF